MQRRLFRLALATLLTLAGCSPREAEPDAPPPLLDAAGRGDLVTLEQLLQDTPADLRDQCQWTPLMKAALHGHRAVVARLLAAGADPDARDQGGYTALMLAASNDHAQTVALLAEQGADLSHQEPGLGWTALIWAAKQGHAASVRVLLQQGADPDARDHAGSRAADWARRNGHAATLALLTSPALTGAPDRSGSGMADD
jgi:ankyrin repeat protein